MATSFDVYEKHITNIGNEIDNAKIDNKRSDYESSLNIVRRLYHSKVELLRLDVEEWSIANSTTTAAKNNNIDSDKIKKAYTDLDMLIKKLNIIPIKRKYHWWTVIDLVFRFVSVCAGIFTFAIFGSFLIISLSVFDYFFISDPYCHISEYVKRTIAKLLLDLCGTSVDIINDNNNKTNTKTVKEYFDSPCAILTFSHASNIDGFLVSCTCPIRHIALAKKELFMVPFFSWISLAFGGMPVDRENKDRAHMALKRSTEQAKHSRVCIVVAPEGTRSTTGQLLPFKKGPFHVWNDLQCPIVPMITYGAYDLYPVGSWINNTGKVAVKYLQPILPSEATNRDHMLRIVRRRMLEAMIDCPTNICIELTWPKRLYCLFVACSVLAFDAVVLYSTHYQLFIKYNCSTQTVAIGSTFITFLITFILYAYNVYIRPYI